MQLLRDMEERFALESKGKGKGEGAEQEQAQAPAAPVNRYTQMLKAKEKSASTHTGNRSALRSKPAALEGLT